MTLHNITSRRIFLYQRTRLRSGAATTSINKEVQALLRVLVGHGFEPTTSPLPDVPRKPRLLTPEEFRRLFETATGKVRWTRALAVAVITAATGLPRKELKRLTWESVDPFRETIADRPFTAEVKAVLIGLEEKRMFTPGRCRRTDLILNFRSWKDAWNSMVAAAGLAGLTLRDLRGRF